MAPVRFVKNTRGIALITVVLVALAVSSMAIAASILTMNGTLIRRFSERSAVADQAALSGLEEALSSVLGNPGIVPATGYATLEDSVAVVDASGTPIPGVYRWTYVGPSNDRARASILSLAKARGGGMALRRMEVDAQSYARYGILIGNDPTAQGFQPSDRMFGPVHFNTGITINSPFGLDTATFWQQVTTTSTIAGIGNGIFRKGYTQNVDPVPFPALSDLDPLRGMATGANLHLTTSIGNPNGALTRLEFIPIDMDPDPVTEDIQGFFRVYTNSISSNMPFVVGWQTGADGPISTSNCGVVSGPPGNATFLRYGYELDIDQAKDSVDNNRYRCFLGGDPALHPGANQSGVFEQTPTGSGPTAGGSWLPWPGPAVSGPASFMGRLDHDYLWPYTPAVNSTTKGVIFIDGEVALSGVVAGKVTVVATDDIVVVDDVTQYTDPGAAACDRDVLGLIAGDDIIISDNTLMTPQRYSTSAAYHTMGKSKDEYLQAVVMSLDEFRVQEAASGPGSGEPCEGTVQGRGCLYLTGSILAGTRGLLGFGSQGYRVRLSYNSCVETQAPPQFPATNLYEKARVYELDPANFDVAAWFTQYQM